MRPAATRRNWHEGTAARYASRSRYSLRGWACGFASGTAHNPHCPCGHSCLVPTLILFAPTLPASGTLRRGIKGQTMCRCVQSRCFTVTLIAARRKHTPRRHAPALVAWQSSRQFAGILHANSAAPPLMQPGEVNWLAALETNLDTLASAGVKSNQKRMSCKVSHPSSVGDYDHD
jgi:hypothetical protein